MSEATIVTRRLSIAPDVDLLPLLGRNDDHLRTLESELAVRVVARGHDITLRGEERQVRRAERALTQLAELVRSGAHLRPPEVRAALRMVTDDDEADLRTVFTDSIAVPSRKKLITPKSLGQKRYVDAIRSHDMVFAIGPAGTGKSFLAVAMAVAALTRREVARIVLTRPAVEAGERLGFLPGDLYEKVHPYLRPLYDALYDMLEAEKVQSLMDKGAIEVAPLAYMRGRTLNDAFIILDEAQNSTAEQMKMFLTRLGFNSKGHHRGHHADRPALLARLRVDRGPERARGGCGYQLRVFRRPRRRATSARLRHHSRVWCARRGAPRRPDGVLMAVLVDNRQTRIEVDEARLARAAGRVLADAGQTAGAVDVAVVDDGEIRRLNRTYRGVSRRTDVLAFPLETPGAAGELLGQVVISAETAARQARGLGVPCALELDLLVTHGVLHLLGYDDRDPVEAALMHRRERALLQRGQRRLPRRLWTGLLAPDAQDRVGRLEPPEPPSVRHGGRPEPSSVRANRGAPRVARGARSGGGHGGRPEPPIK